MRTMTPAAVLAALVSVTTLPTHAANTATLGGPGGGPVSIACNDSERLIGVGARYGAWLDWVGPICVRVNAEMAWSGIPRGDIYVPPRKKSVFEQVGSVWASFLPWNLPSTLGPKVIEGTFVPGMGGDGGGFITFLVCPEHFFVYGFDATVVGGRNLVARLALRCRNPRTAEESWVALPPPAPASHPYYNLTGSDCPAGEMANGIYGKSGVFVDSFGLTCLGTPSLAFCQGYTDQAVSQADENERRRCGYEGPRWVRDAAAHRSWCMSLGGNQGPPNTEGAARAQQLRDCQPDLSVAQLRLPSHQLNRNLSSGVAIRTLPGAITAPEPQPAPAPMSYPLACAGGGGMTASMDNGTAVVTFAPANYGSAAVPPGAGECAWIDRGFRPGEPGMLRIEDPALSEQARALLAATTAGGTFRVNGYNNGQGAMIVTAIEQVSAAPALVVADALVNGDVDLYDMPGGVGRVVGMLRRGSRVSLLSCREDNWCQIRADAPEQAGWMWGDFLDR